MDAFMRLWRWLWGEPHGQIFEYETVGVEGVP